MKLCNSLTCLLILQINLTAPYSFLVCRHNKTSMKFKIFQVFQLIGNKITTLLWYVMLPKVITNVLAIKRSHRYQLSSNKMFKYLNFKYPCFHQVTYHRFQVYLNKTKISYRIYPQYQPYPSYSSKKVVNKILCQHHQVAFSTD